MNEEVDALPDLPKEKKRSRKKLLYSNIKGLMEFYFSAANLAKDRWLTQSLDESGCKYFYLQFVPTYSHICKPCTDHNDSESSTNEGIVLGISHRYFPFQP